MKTNFLRNLEIIKIALLLVGLVSSGLSSATEEVVIADTDFPLWQVKNDQYPYGTSTNILVQLTQKLGLTATVKACPFKRCLAMLKSGEVDIMGALLKTEERRKYLHYLTPPYTKTVNRHFYLLSEDSRNIDSYDDLYGLKIGILRGRKFFKKFDTDENLTIIRVTTLEELFKMLQNKRIDTIASGEMTADNLIKTLNIEKRFKKSKFLYNPNRDVFAAISKNSPFGNRTQEFAKALEQMILSGEVEKIRSQYR